MKQKDLKIDFRYLTGNIACLSVDSISGESVHNDINNEEAIIIFNSLVGEKEDCQTVKSLLKENEELKKQLEISKMANDKNVDIACELIIKYKNQQQEFIEYLEDEKDRLARECSNICKDKFDEANDILQKYEEIIGVEDENK